jgi:hypothetical protein
MSKKKPFLLPGLEMMRTSAVAATLFALSFSLFLFSSVKSYIFTVPKTALALFRRLTVIVCTGLEILPHATFIAICAVCGVSIKDSYGHVFPLTIIMPIFLTILCILMIQVNFI